MAASVVSSQVTEPAALVAQQAPVSAPAPAGFGNMSLYVGDLDPTVNEAQLYDLFSQVAQVASLRVCRDQSRMLSLGYAYVNYSNPQDAANAKELLNFAPLNGKPIRIMYSQRDPSMRKSGYANLFIKNLEKSIDNKALLETFSTFGTVLSCKVATDADGQSKGYGFVQYDNEESANNAIDKLHGMLINEKKVDVQHYVRSPRNNIYVKNLSETTTEEDLKKHFKECDGKITSVKIATDGQGKSRCFGFVNYDDAKGAASAIEKFNGTTFNGKVLFVGKAQKKAERQAELRAKFEQERISKFDKLQGANLYLKNLDDTINDDKLQELFSEFGTITSCKVMLDHQGISKGSGFVAFSTPEEANKALNEMNGKMIGRKPLYVAVAQRKEERRARLQARFAQIGAPGGMTPLPSAIPGYHPGAPRLAPQQLYFGQGGLVPHQPAGYGFQQQIIPGMRPGVSPNFILPYHLPRPGQPAGQRMGVRRGGNFQQVQQQQQLMHRNSNQGVRYLGNARNGVDSAASPQGLASPMMPLPFDGSVPVRSNDVQRTGPVPMSKLASALASATPEHQRLMLGEQLYPLVEHIEPELTSKVTGMLLEMDQTEVLHLIESPDALKDKVAEAMDVLRKATSKADVTDQLGALDLN
ncbi:polyadenylate-binding protein 3 [Argentina anserina]|uniref:polyadenylate-binding protein 3 n=1 Tax=Argentina anserina TaxID=57926 RepID=UPI0021769561|nr:polyadenylate-binding protein 3 [Potentilla anserina]